MGECWGYNRFYRIDQLESEGYLSNDSEDCLYLKFYVRPPTYAILARDQKRYIEELEKKVKAQEEENTQFRKKCAEQIKRKNKKTSDKKQRISKDKEESKVVPETSTFDEQPEEIVPDKQKVKKLRVVNSKKNLEASSHNSQASLFPKPDTKLN